jgi:hypothetical protein
MPRRTLPHRGCDPVQIVQPFVFTAAQHQPILDALPCLRGEESEFIAGLERCARRFLWLRNQYHVARMDKTLQAWGVRRRLAPED